MTDTPLDRLENALLAYAGHYPASHPAAIAEETDLRRDLLDAILDAPATRMVRRLRAALAVDDRYHAAHGPNGDAVYPRHSHPLPSHQRSVNEALAVIRADAHQIASAEPVAWCVDCGGYRVVEEETDEGHMTREGEVGYRVTHLMCGHSREGIQVVVARAAGAPVAYRDLFAVVHHRDLDADL